MNKKQLKILQGRYADADFIPEDAVPDCKVGITGADKYHRISKTGHHNRAPIAVQYRQDRDRLANQHGHEANQAWAAELRRRREVELAERLARWESAQAAAGGSAATSETRKCMDCPTLLPADGKRRCQPCADRKAVRDKRTRDIRNARRKAEAGGVYYASKPRSRAIEVILELDEDIARHGDSGIDFDKYADHASGGVAASEAAF